MKPLYIKIVLYDPISEDPVDLNGYAVLDGVEVQIARVDPSAPEDAEEIHRLTPDPVLGTFAATSRHYRPSPSHHLRVKFIKKNFSKVTRILHELAEVTPAMLPLYCPARVPFWDTGWDDGYQTNELFGDNALKVSSSPENPYVIRIPVRRIYVIGHRGAPYHFPENTIASFQKALALGANALELDLCLTKDEQIVLFHDSHPDSTRIQFEDFPFELVSPEFDGDVAMMKELADGDYRTAKQKTMRSGNSMDIVRLAVDRVRQWYRYRNVEGVEYPIPDLEEFLTFASQESQRLKLLFFDVKSPGWHEERHRRKFVSYGTVLGKSLRRHADLPERLVVANESRKILEYLKEGIHESGENRCEFAFDATGSFGAIFGFKQNPLAVAREMKNTVVSIGTRFRSGDLEEIIEATRDRDYNMESDLTTVLHWTINDPAQMYHSFVAGVNGIVTDRPDVLRGMLTKLGVYV